jgi:hypothetical protein
LKHRTNHPYLKKGDKYTYSAKNAVEGFLGYLGFDPTMGAIFELWDKEARAYVRGCEALGMQGKKIWVKVPSAVHRQELMFYKDRVLSRINQAMGRKAVMDIQFELEKGDHH